MFTAHLILFSSDSSVYVSVQEIKPSLWVHTSHYESKTDRNKNESPFQRVNSHREAVPLAMLTSRVTTLVVARSLVVVVAPLAVAGTGPVRAW
jgi:hypothetical protein